MPLDGGGGLGHLHQGENALLHPGPAAGGEDDEGQAPPGGILRRPGDLLPHGGAHAAHEEAAVQHHAHGLAAHDLAHGGHRRIPQALRDLVACKEDAVLAIIQGLIQLVFPRVGILGVHLGGQGQVIGGQIHLHLVLHSAVNVHGEQNGEKDYRQQQHRKDGPHNEPRLAPPGLYLPGGSLGMALSLDLVQLILSGIFYFFGALLQLVSQAMFASLVLAHNGAPSFLSEFLCILLNSNHFNTIHQQGQTMVKIHYKFYFTMAVNLE